ncbi:hypothetical protein AB1Y20_021453 [Prymnesium parvum]|uniref:Fungal lipase-type domain-containing protein n=1 Tax=Prymnesium parvum TaxID=97485 RepID=A0AB34JLK1_PRYPA
MQQAMGTQLGGACSLLASRQLVTDVARISEQLVMDDMLCDYWPCAGSVGSAPAVSCREKAAWPDKCGDIDELREVRRRRAVWAAEIRERYNARVVEWCDTGQGLEKQAVVVLLRPAQEDPIAVVAWRGSKKLADYFLTDISLTFHPLRRDRGDVEPAKRKGGGMFDAILGRGGPMLLLRDSPVPCATRGLWEAYAGSAAREVQQVGPRAQVARALEKLLADEPRCRLCIAGHSLGGALATLCAYDLLTTSAAARARGLTMISFAAPRFFNAGFQKAMRALQQEGALCPLRVLVPTDLVPRLPPRQIGGLHGVMPRLLLDPVRADSRKSPREPLSFQDVDRDDDDIWHAGQDMHAHTSHALYLGGECTPKRPQTVPLEVEWPLSSPAANIPAG